MGQVQLASKRLQLPYAIAFPPFGKTYILWGASVLSSRLATLALGLWNTCHSS